MNNSKLTRWELINSASNAQDYVKQLRGVLCSIADSMDTKDDEESWQISALITLAHLASEELEPAVNASVKEPEANHAA